MNYNKKIGIFMALWDNVDTKRDYYKDLELDFGEFGGLPSGDANDPKTLNNIVRSKYRHLAHKYHPDHNPGNDAGEKFTIVTNAYEILTNPHLRARYDKYSSQWYKPPQVDMINWLAGGVNQEAWVFHSSKNHGYNLRLSIDRSSPPPETLIKLREVGERLDKIGINYELGVNPTSQFLMVPAHQFGKLVTYYSHHINPRPTQGEMDIFRREKLRTRDYNDTYVLVEPEDRKGPVQIMPAALFNEQYNNHVGAFKEQPLSPAMMELWGLLSQKGIDCSVHLNPLKQPSLDLPPEQTFEKATTILSEAMAEKQQRARSNATREQQAATEPLMYETDGFFRTTPNGGIEIQNAHVINILNNARETLTAVSLDTGRSMSMGADGIIHNGTVRVNGIVIGTDIGYGIDLKSFQSTKGFFR